METEKIILNTSEEAATFKTGISGWVDRHGRFYGNDERMARWSGATHALCKGCGNPVKKSWLFCADCRLKRSIERYNKMESKEWDFETPLYSDTADRYFFDASDDLADFINEHDCSIESLRLIICEPMYLKPIDEDYFCDDLPEDGELPGEVWDALYKLNLTIRKQDPVGWMPGKYAAIISEQL